MSRARNNGSPGSDRDPSAPRARKPKTQADPAITSDGGAAGASTNNHRKDASAGSRDPDYEVGYGRPPREHQFKSGQSGNPRGRPKGVQSEAETWRKVMSKKVPIQEKGRTRYVTAYEAILLRMTQEGLKGQFRPGQFLLKGHPAVAERSGDQATEMNEDDRAVLDSYLAQLMNPQTNGDST